MSDPPSTDERLPAIVDEFGAAIDHCRDLYAASATDWVRLDPGRLTGTAEETHALMDDLSRGLVLKVFLSIVRANKRFDTHERRLAQVLLVRAWGRTFVLEELGQVMQQLMPLADKFDWYSLIRPFDEVPALQDRVKQVEEIVARLANLVARADGKIDPAEAIQLRGVQDEISRHLRPVPLEDDVDERLRENSPHCEAIRRALDEMPAVGRHRPGGDVFAESTREASSKELSREERLVAAMKALEELIGLTNIKSDVRELARFLKVQQERVRAGLPQTQVSLHSVFTGNPGTGKTTVARIIADILGALGVLKKGHLIEADRSSLVAGYAGQTSIKTNKLIDDALDGVLFIDEAYSLVSETGEDSYGNEAVQVLLKRMEDDRDRLVVILAGYPEPMERLLETNPGIASRFQRTFQYADYTVTELCRIFQAMCEKNHYELPAPTRGKLLLGFAWLLLYRDERFGNGRLVRNVFENSIRRLANRVADITPLTKELLTRLESIDIAMPNVPESAYTSLETDEIRFRVTCPGCHQTSKLKGSFLGRRVKCNKCKRQFTAEWGEPA